MSSMRGIYTSAAKRQLRNLYATWEPSRPISLGDYGTLSGDWFDPLGSVTEFGVSWTELPLGEGLTHQKFVSSDSVDVKLHARGTAPEAKASLEVTFGKAQGVFLDAAGCSYHAIASKRLLGEALKANPEFDRRWVVVTDLLRAKRTLVAISNSSNATISFEASASVPEIDLADGDVGLSVGRQTSIGYLVDGVRDLSPLIGLSGFRHKFLSGEAVFKGMTWVPADEGAGPAGDVNDVEFEQIL
jgi:hypothetical protein